MFSGERAGGAGLTGGFNDLRIIKAAKRPLRSFEDLHGSLAL